MVSISHAGHRLNKKRRFRLEATLFLFGAGLRAGRLQFRDAAAVGKDGAPRHILLIRVGQLFHGLLHG